MDLPFVAACVLLAIAVVGLVAHFAGVERRMRPDWLPRPLWWLLAVAIGLALALFSVHPEDR